jgi:hypothetical protein
MLLKLLAVGYVCIVTADNFGAAELRLLQWNVADYLVDDVFVTTADVAGRLMSKIRSWHIDQLPDVITLNEDIEFDPNFASNALSLTPHGYRLAGTCRGEALWPFWEDSNGTMISNPTYLKGGRFLRNAIWLNEKRWTLDRVKTFNTSNSSVVRTKDPSVCGPGWQKGKFCEVPRCAVVAVLSLASYRNTLVTIASTYMSGGRFADLNYQISIGEKAKGLGTWRAGRPVG